MVTAVANANTVFFMSETFRVFPETFNGQARRRFPERAVHNGRDELSLDERQMEPMCNLYSITTNQAAIIGLFRVIDRYVGNLAPMPGVFPNYPAPVIRNTLGGREMMLMRWGMPSR